MDDLLADFVAETREMMEAIESEIIAWEANPADSTRLDAIFRFVHTVKGNCGFFDFPRLQRLSHAAEEALAEVRANRRAPDARLVSTILATIDCIGEIIDRIEADKPLPRGRELPLIAALERGSELDAREIVAAPSAKSDATSPDSPAVMRSIRLPVDLLDRVMSGVSDMVLARNDLAHRLQSAGTQPTIDGPFERLTTILNDVRDAITRMRMQRVETLFNVFPRLVRDLSADLGKQVSLEIEGADVELDREVIEMIRDPMTHIVRNAIGHGIETPDERNAAGKEELGHLRIAARQTGNRISIVISDDGRGLDDDKIAAKAIANGMITDEDRANMSREDVLQLVFEPGLSTAEEVSNVSGRGVGLDVVRDNLERVGGWIEVESNLGEGASLHLHIPLTLSIIAGLVVSSAGQRYAIPQSFVEEIVHGSNEALEHVEVGEKSLVTRRGERVPCLSLAQVLGVPETASKQDQSIVFVQLAKGDVFAIAVDTIESNGDIVVKPVSPVVMEAGCYSGTALLDDGRPIMLLDLPQIAEESGAIDHERSFAIRAGDEESEASEESKGMAMLFIGCDGYRRAIRLDLIRRIETISASDVDLSGTRPRATIEGQIIALAGLENAPLSNAKLRVLRLSDGTGEVLFAVQEIRDAIELQGECVPVADDPQIEGIVLVEGETVELVDGHALFAAVDSFIAPQTGKTCRIPDTEWARTVLAPMIRSAGYTVVFGETTPADIAVLFENEDSSQSAAIPASHIVRLHDKDRTQRTDGGAVYRYDRDAVLAALAKAPARTNAGRKSA